ncbi:MAG: LuxR C-terminal-related transcriptional regulator [Acidimicrobiales bacterium]
MAARSWPFVGREELVADVVASLDHNACVVLAGRAGLGKTRTAVETAARLTDRGVLVARVVASPASSPVPLAPFAHLIGAETGAAAVTAVLDALGTDRRRGAADAVLVVDDIHLLDEASATVVQQLSVSGSVRVLATLRSGASVPTAVERLMVDADAEVIDVAPMSDASILQMVEATLQGPLDPRSCELLTSMAGGNPLFAHEIVEGSIASGRLTLHGGVWQLDGDPAASPLLEEVVLARLVPLEGRDRDAIELLTIGGALPLDLLDRIVGTEALERLERLELIAATPGPGSSITVDVAHPLQRELVRARLGAIARMRLARTLAQASGPPGPARPVADNLRSALWHVRGGLQIDTAQLIEAAQQLLGAGDPALGAELAEAAFTQSGSVRAAMLASWCLAQVGDHGRAIEVIATARATSTDGWERAAMRMRVAEELWWTGRRAEGLAELDAADHDPPGPWLDLIEAQRGVFAMLDGDVAEARRRCEHMLDHEHLWVRFAASVAIGNVGVIADEPERTLELCRKVHAEAQEADVELVGGADIHLAIQLNALVHAGQLEFASALASAAHEQAAQQPSLQTRAWAATLLGRVASFTGDLTTACRAVAEAERLWIRSGHQGIAGWCAAGLAQAQVQLGAADEAGETIERIDGYERRGFGQYEATVSIARAWLAHAVGDRAGAASHLRAAIERTISLGETTVLGWAWHDAARLDLLGLLTDLPVWPRPTQAFSATRWDFVDARRTGDGPALERIGSAFEAIGARLYAAEAYASASASMRRAGDPREAARLDGRAGGLVASCGGVVTPLLAGRHAAGPLSAREHEIASLAAAGLSNRQIARRAVVSERTVENHLYRVFIKLGISSRAELPGALG